MLIYCDGASIPNPGVMGIGVVLGDETRTLSRYCGPGNNQRAELLALQESLHLSNFTDTIFSDSRYAVEIGRGAWRARVHIDLIREIRHLFEAKRVSLQWMPGHRGHPLQELADRLAYKAAKTRRSTIDPLVITVGTRTESVGA